ncbi:MAG: VOC family protein [Mycobacteriales bacterium]
MPTRSESWPAGTPSWIDLTVPDLEAAKTFYGDVAGWTFVDTGADFGHYTLCQAGGRNAAALSPPQGPEQPSAWTVYLATDDTDASAKQVVANGGSIIVDPMDIPGTGKMAIARDPQGASFGLWQSAGMIGTEVYSEPGALVWTDLRTSDPDAARSFYAALFGYHYKPMEGAPDAYQVFGFDGARDGETVGGIGPMMHAGDTSPPHWIAYVIVTDAEASAAAARSGGGSVATEPFDTPFGKMAELVDPFGAKLAIMGVPPSS